MKFYIEKCTKNKFFIVILSLIIFIYLSFLILPLIISPVLNKYAPEIERIVKDSANLNLKLDGIGVITTASLDLGIKAKNIELSLSQNSEKLLKAENLKVDLKLLPLIIKKIQLGNITADNINVTLGIKPNGDFDIIDYFPETPKEQEALKSLPLGFKFSNHLPNIKIKNYKISLKNIQNFKEYFIEGKQLAITEFILDKKIKFATKGKVVFDNHNISNYDIKIYNKIMPNLSLDDLIFPKEVQIETAQPQIQQNQPQINLTDILNAVVNRKLHADILADIKTSGTFKSPIQKGKFEINHLTTELNNELLPEGYIKLLFKDHYTNIDTIFYTSNDKNESTKICGNIKSGKKHFIDLSVKSNAKFNNIIKLINSIAQSFNYNDLKTLSATGAIDANFNIKSDFNNLISNGYLKVAPSSLKYGLYNLNINNINADINLENNNLKINNAGFSIFEHPLRLSGTITNEAIANLKLTAEKLSIKGLLLTICQFSLLKENNINSGTLSVIASIKGKLTEIKPDIKLSVNDINIFNLPLKTELSLKEGLIDLLLERDKFNGDIALNSLKISMDGSNITVPTAKICANSKDIDIKDSHLLLNNSRVDVKGIVKDYLTKDLDMNITASGNLSGADVSAFIPKDMRSMFPYRGSMPIKINAVGNDKKQKISFDLSATPSGFINILDIDKIRGKSSKIHSELNIENNNITIENSGLFVQNKSIAAFSGSINNITDPNLNINVSVPSNLSFIIPGMGNNSNITARGNVLISGSPFNPKLKGKVYLNDISIKEMDFALSNTVAQLNGEGIKGNATADTIKFGGIVGTNLFAKFELRNFTDFILENINSEAFSGKVSGNLSYNIPNFAFSLNMTGKNLNSMDAVYGAVGIPKALTGTLGFNTKLTGKGITDTEIIKSLKGNVDFDIKDGRFVSIGKLENIVNAQNITSNSILKSALSALTTANSIQETDKFKTITGNLTLYNGSANISNIEVSGPLMSYYVKGLYNIIPNTANLTILGRLDSKIITYLGPLGQLSAQKLLSYIPKFGTQTAQILDKLTQDPKNENISLIPKLTTGSENYKDFKVIFNGSVEKSTSVKSFKWLSVCDTSEMNIKQEAKNALQSVKDNINNQINSAKNSAENVKTNVTNIINTQKQNIENQKNAIEQTKQDVKNIKENAKQNTENLKKILLNATTNASKKVNEGLNTQTDPKTETSQTSQTQTQSQTSTSSDTQTANQNSTQPHEQDSSQSSQSE